MFHDETKDVPGRNFKGHILFFVPEQMVSISSTPLFGVDSIEYYPKEELAHALFELRLKLNYRGKFHFSKIGGDKWGKSDLAHRTAVELAIDGLCNKHQKSFKYPLHCKLAVMFYPSQADSLLYGGASRKERRMRHDETILRILLKGAAHYLYDDNNHIEIANIVADGQPEHRKMDPDRIIWQLTYDGLSGRTPLRDYVSFSPKSTIIHLPSDHRSYTHDSEEHKNAHMLQLADLLLGSSLRSCYVGITSKKKLPRLGDECIKKDLIAHPVKEMFDKRRRGSGFRNSGHFKSFTISWIEFSEGNANFRELQTMQIPMSDENSLQMQIPFNNEV